MYVHIQTLYIELFKLYTSYSFSEWFEYRLHKSFLFTINIQYGEFSNSTRQQWWNSRNLSSTQYFNLWSTFQFSLLSQKCPLDNFLLQYRILSRIPWCFSCHVSIFLWSRSIPWSSIVFNGTDVLEKYKPVILQSVPQLGFILCFLKIRFKLFISSEILDMLFLLLIYLPIIISISI